MSLPRVIFYAEPGFESEIVETGLSNIGFTLASVSEKDELLIALNLDPEAIVLIDAAGRGQELERLLPSIQALQKSPAPIFIMDSQDRFKTALPNVRVIPPERRLRGAVFGIAEYAGLGT